MLRSSYLATLLVTFLAATVFFYVSYQAICALPFSYQVSTVDERFGLSQAEAEAAVATAVAVWEDSLEREVFTAVTTDADFAVNFIFDERQVRTDAQVRERERLAAVESQSEEVQVAYRAQVAVLEEREASYETRSARYERDLVAYNQTVAQYNEEGGAPEEVFAELEAERLRLDREATALNQEVNALNELVDQINQLGEQGNVLLSRFNDRVDTFNDTFADGREFTQGDWQGDRINIYSFADAAELEVVLVHELGHALGLDHVADETAYLHYLLGAQTPGSSLQPDDIAAFSGTCSLEARLATVPQPWRWLFATLEV